MKSYGPGDMQAPAHRQHRYDYEAEAKRISEIDDWVERRQALDNVPRAYQGHVNGLVSMLFKARNRG